MGISATAVAELWQEARGLTERASAEADHAALRRALVILAVAGSGDDPAEFRRLADALAAAATRLAFADPQPLFDAAAALVAAEDYPAREAIVLAPERATSAPPGAGFPRQ